MLFRSLRGEILAKIGSPRKPRLGFNVSTAFPEACNYGDIRCMSRSTQGYRIIKSTCQRLSLPFSYLSNPWSGRSPVSSPLPTFTDPSGKSLDEKGETRESLGLLCHRVPFMVRLLLENRRSRIHCQRSTSGSGSPRNRENLLIFLQDEGMKWAAQMIYCQ